MAAEPLFVSEIFGPTFQGEGKSLGMPCMFLRLAGCNLSCAWCDTPYTWDWKRFDPRQEVHPLSLDAVHERLRAAPVRNLVVSGGEPMLQQGVLRELTRRLHEEGWWTEMETAGTVAPRSHDLVKQFNVSPKLSNSGNLAEKRLNREALFALKGTGRAVWKFVIREPGDLDELAALVSELELSPVYVMPEGVDEATLQSRLRWLAERAVAHGYYLSPRLHVTVHGARRGV